MKGKLKVSKRKYTQEQLREMRKAAMTMAAAIRAAKGWNKSNSLKWAWKMVKNQVAAKVAGVTFGRRQEAIKRLFNYDPRRVVFTLRRERANQYDHNAIAIDVTVIGKGTYTGIGYLKRDVAKMIAPLMDKNIDPRIMEWDITGEEDYMGIKLKMELVAGITKVFPNEKSTVAAGKHTNSALIAIQ